MATILAAAGAPAAKSADAAPAEALPADSCFDHVAVVLDNKPQRNNKPHRTPAAAAYTPETTPPDVHPVVILSMDEPHPCSAYSPIGDMWLPRPATWALGSNEDSPAPPSGFGQAWLGVEAPRSAPPSFAQRLPPSDSGQEAIVPDAPPLGGLTVGGGFVLAGSGLRGHASGDSSRRLATASGAAGSASGPGPMAGPLAGAPSKAPDLVPQTPPAGAPGTVGDPSGVPEPATWLMLVAGAFSLGAALRRRPRGLAA